MSIQGAINQMAGTVGVASALYQQTPKYKEREAEKNLQKEVDTIQKDYKEHINSPFGGKQAFDRQKSSIEFQEDNELYESEEEKLRDEVRLLQYKANIEGIKSEMYQTLQSTYKEAGKYGKAFRAGISVSTSEKNKLHALQNLEKKKKLMAEQVESIKAKRKSYLDLPTSLGGTLGDLNLDAQQRREVRAQIYPKKGGK